MHKVKRQHYVWKHYLKPWADGVHIWTYQKKDNKIFKANLEGVAQERYFYKLGDFTENEIIFLEWFIKNHSSIEVRRLNRFFLQLFTSTETQPNAREEDIEKSKINGMETAHGRIELLGKKLLSCRNIYDIKALGNDKYFFEAIIFLCFQYFRTRKMRDSELQFFVGYPYEELANKSWNIIVFMYATTLAVKIILRPEIKFVFVENNTDNHFVTSDQPVFIPRNGQVDERVEVTQLEIYYPISPNHALYIHFRDDQKGKYGSQIADNILIDSLNKKVFDNADFLVFADSEEQLEKMK